MPALGGPESKLVDIAGLRGDVTAVKPAVEAGIKESMARGGRYGYPLVDIRAVCVDGKHHSVDSNEMAFKIAGSMGFREGAVKADPVLYAHASRILHQESNPGNARALVQRHATRELWLNPPALPKQLQDQPRRNQRPRFGPFHLRARGDAIGRRISSNGSRPSSRSRSAR